MSSYEYTGQWIHRVHAVTGKRQTKAHLCETTVNRTYTTRCGKRMNRLTSRGVVEPVGQPVVRLCTHCQTR